MCTVKILTIADLEEKTFNYRSCKNLFKLFLREFPSMKLDWETSWNEWTIKLLTFFAELGKFYDFEVYLTPKCGVLTSNKENTSEYLVDLSWCFEDEKKRAEWIELALESELSSQDIDEIMYDFSKLVEIKSYVKVGIFAPKLSDRDTLIEDLE